MNNDISVKNVYSAINLAHNLYLDYLDKLIFLNISPLQSQNAGLRVEVNIFHLDGECRPNSITWGRASYRFRLDFANCGSFHETSLSDEIVSVPHVFILLSNHRHISAWNKICKLLHAQYSNFPVWLYPFPSLSRYLPHSFIFVQVIRYNTTIYNICFYSSLFFLLTKLSNTIIFYDEIALFSYLISIHHFSNIPSVNSMGYLIWVHVYAIDVYYVYVS